MDSPGLREPLADLAKPLVKVLTAKLFWLTEGVLERPDWRPTDPCNQDWIASVARTQLEHLLAVVREQVNALRRTPSDWDDATTPWGEGYNAAIASVLRVLDGET